MKIDSRTDATTSGLVPRYHRREAPYEASDLILAYVPESEHLTYAEALALAEERDEQAAEQLRLSVPDGVLPYTYDEALQRRLAESPFRDGILVTQMPDDKNLSSLTPPLNPRKVWGKP